MMPKSPVAKVDLMRRNTHTTVLLNGARTRVGVRRAAGVRESCVTYTSDLPHVPTSA